MRGATNRGLIALVGSGEFLPVMDGVDRDLLEGRPPRAVFLPTAAAEEGQERVRYWVELGTAHFRRLGVEPVPLTVLDRAGAEDASLAAAVAGAGLVYLSGGNPGYLAATLRGSAVWRAIVDSWQAGTALAGCSAGAAALTAVAGNVRDPEAGDLDHTHDVGAGGGQAHLALLAAQALEHADQAAQSGGVDEPDLGQVDHQAVDAALGHLVEPGAQGRGGIDVDVPFDVHDRPAVALRHCAAEIQ